MFSNDTMRRIVGNGKIHANALGRIDRTGSQEHIDENIRKFFIEIQINSDSALVSLARRSDESPLLLRAIRLPSGGDRAAFSDTLILAYAEDHSLPDLSNILRYLGLTPAEARLANRVGSGESPGEAARVLGVTVETARMVLKAAFQKLDIHTQSKLAVFLGKISLLR